MLVLVTWRHLFHIPTGTLVTGLISFGWRFETSRGATKESTTYNLAVSSSPSIVANLWQLISKALERCGNTSASTAFPEYLRRSYNVSLNTPSPLAPNSLAEI